MPPKSLIVIRSVSFQVLVCSTFHQNSCCHTTTASWSMLSFISPEVENLGVCKYLSMRKEIMIIYCLFNESCSGWRELTWDGYERLLHMHELLVIGCTRLIDWNARFICCWPFVRHHARNLLIQRKLRKFILIVWIDSLLTKFS